MTLVIIVLIVKKKGSLFSEIVIGESKVVEYDSR